jgi:hypothetical protein
MKQNKRQTESGLKVGDQVKMIPGTGPAVEFRLTCSSGDRDADITSRTRLRRPAEFSAAGRTCVRGHAPRKLPGQGDYSNGQRNGGQ